MVFLFSSAVIVAEVIIPPITYKEWVKTEPFVEGFSTNPNEWNLLDLNGNTVNAD
jgi:hypothetical protein